MELTQEWYLHEFSTLEDKVQYRSLEDEYRLYEAIASGNTEYVKHDMTATWEKYQFPKLYADDELKNIRYSFTTFAALVSRYCAKNGLEQEKSYSLNSFYVRKMDSLKNKKEMIQLFQTMALDYCQKMKDLSKNNTYSKAIVLCLDYIYAHMQDRITIKTLSEHLGLSESYLSKLFHKEVGVTLSQYIMDLKLEKAKNLLQYSEFSVIDIANYLSFSSQSHFIQTFQKSVGLTPLKYRNQYFRTTWK